MERYIGVVGVIVLASEDDTTSLPIRACLPRNVDILRLDGTLTSETRLAARVLFQSSACSSGVSGAGKNRSSLARTCPSAAPGLLSVELCAESFDGRGTSGSDDFEELSVKGVVEGESRVCDGPLGVESRSSGDAHTQSEISSAEWKDSAAVDSLCESDEFVFRGMIMGEGDSVLSWSSSVYEDKVIRGRLL